MKRKGIYNIYNNYDPAWYILQCDSGVKEDVRSMSNT